MKKLIAIFVLITSVSFAQAQTSRLKYQGEVLAGYSIGVGTFGMDRINIHTTHGIRFSEYFYAGLGLGLNCYTSASEVAMPLFVNAKGYLPVSDKTSLFVSLDLGGTVGLSEGLSGIGGFLAAPAVGASFKVSQKSAINLSLGYDCQKWSESGVSITDGTFAIKVGFQF